MSLEELAKTAAGVTHNNNGNIGTGSQKKKKRRVLTPLKCKLHLSSKPQVPNGENGNNPVTAESVTSGQFRFPHGMPTSSSLLRLNALREVPPTETSDGPQQTGECPKKGKATRRARSAGDFGLKRLSSSAHPIPQLKAPAFCCTFRRAKTRATLAVSAIPEPLTPEYGASPLKEKNRVTESAVSPSLDNAMGQKLQEELLKPNTFPSRRKSVGRYSVARCCILPNEALSTSFLLVSAFRPRSLFSKRHYFAALSYNHLPQVVKFWQNSSFFLACSRW